MYKKTVATEKVCFNILIADCRLQKKNGEDWFIPLNPSHMTETGQSLENSK